MFIPPIVAGIVAVLMVLKHVNTTTPTRTITTTTPMYMMHCKY